MKTTRTTVFLSLAILASFLFASSAFADVTYTNATIPADNIITGTGDGGVGNVTFNITGTNPATYGGSMSGSGNVTKTGNGELILSGKNTYTGSTTISAGTLT